MESKAIHHEGKVVGITDEKIVVMLHKSGACGGCSAKGKCGMAESSQMEMQIPHPHNEQFEVGDNVVVSVTMGMGRQAVIFAYVLPLIILVFSMTLGGIFALAEWALALIGLVGVACYYFFLYLVRGKIDRKINFTITKNGDFNLYSTNA